MGESPKEIDRGGELCGRSLDHSWKWYNHSLWAGDESDTIFSMSGIVNEAAVVYCLTWLVMDEGKLTSTLHVNSGD
jgi:hypothetical protein